MYERKDINTQEIKHMKTIGEHFGDSKFMAVYYIHLPTCHPKRLEAPDGHKHYLPPKEKIYEESKDNLTPTDGARKLLVEGTRQAEWKNPERGHSLTD